MTLPHDICFLVPCSPDLLPEYEEDRTWLATLALPDGIAPIYVVFSIISAANPPIPTVGPLMTEHPANFIFDGLMFGLAISVWPVQHDPAETIDWPPFPFFGVLTAG